MIIIRNFAVAIIIGCIVVILTKETSAFGSVPTCHSHHRHGSRHYFLSSSSSLGSSSNTNNNNDDDDNNDNNDNDNDINTTTNNKDDTKKTTTFPKSNDNNDNDDNNNDISSRFVAPRMDDPGLPIADAITSGFAAPSMYVLWCGLTHARTPSWLIGASPMRGSLVAPTLSHGAGLACCWLLGALASRAYERPAFDISVEGGGGGYSEVLKRVVQGGAFATGILIFATQIDLFFEFGRKVQFGESEDIDVRLLTASFELLSDVMYEALALITWRLYLAYQSSSRIQR